MNDDLAVVDTKIRFAAVRAAARLCHEARLSFWDALIVVAASRSKAKILYTEDLSDGQVILGVEIVNLFRAEQLF